MQLQVGREDVLVTRSVAFGLLRTAVTGVPPSRWVLGTGDERAAPHEIANIANIATNRTIQLPLIGGEHDVMRLVADLSDRPPVLTHAGFVADTGCGAWIW
ncbi:hypothetical protein GCM10023191_078470 [Actinoallomurus oryzae]|uniref:Uncharacterized protein n=1 Tax=Actinoallomurus oryzae TaxID=502180 RepID=A0ABP8QXG9_9ACTN